MPMRKWITRLVLAGLALFLAIQLVPYGRDHDNPKVSRCVAWPDPDTQALARRACLDCHSNETVWPWYSNVAPMSWLVYRDVKKGRKSVNFSEWDKDQDGSDNTAEMIKKGKMPYGPYMILHPEARLTAAEKDKLINGLDRICATDEPGEKSGDKPDKEDKAK